jgi:hypothetical protein
MLLVILAIGFLERIDSRPCAIFDGFRYIMLNKNLSTFYAMFMDFAFRLSYYWFHVVLGQ